MNNDALVAIGRSSCEVRKVLLQATEAEAKSKPGSGSGNGAVQRRWHKKWISWISLCSVALQKIAERDKLVDELATLKRNLVAESAKSLGTT